MRHPAAPSVLLAAAVLLLLLNALRCFLLLRCLFLHCLVCSVVLRYHVEHVHCVRLLRLVLKVMVQ